MTWLNILYLVLGIIGTLLSMIPVVVKLIQSIKKYKAAKTEADKERAFNDMLTQAQSLIQAAEVAFDGFTSAGAMKKENVVSKLQSYALDNGYTYDADFWSAKIDEIVAFTREVNAKK